MWVVGVCGGVCGVIVSIDLWVGGDIGVSGDSIGGVMVGGMIILRQQHSMLSVVLPQPTRPT